MGDTLTFTVEAMEFSAVRDGSTLRLSIFNPYDGSTRTVIGVKQPQSFDAAIPALVHYTWHVRTVGPEQELKAELARELK